MRDLAILAPAEIVNFRDLGGLAAGEGRKLRFGRLIRSSCPSGFDIEAWGRLRSAGIDVVHDLRMTSERFEVPTRAAKAGLSVREQDYELDTSAMDLSIADGTLTETAARAIMLDAYRSLPFQLAPIYGQMLEDLASGRPVLVHCAAGKDRTGIAVALALRGAGLPVELILEDYLRLESKHTDRPQAMAPLRAVDPAYLRSTFEEIDRRAGSFDAYLADVLRLDSGIRQRLAAELIDG